MFWIHLAFLVLLVGTESFFLWLDVANLRHGEESARERREELRDQFDVEDVERLLGYQRLKTGFGQLQSWLGLVVLLLVLYSGLFERGISRLDSLALGPVVEGVVLFGALVVLGFAFSLPFSAFSTFVIEELYDFNRQTPGPWLVDRAKGLLIGLVLTSLLGGALLYFIEVLPGTWWLAGWGLTVLFGLAMQVLYPRVIAPMFNDFEPVEEGEVREAVDRVFERAGFHCRQVYTMDASRRSSHSNAYFIGFGRTKRVVLFDTLLEQMGPTEVQGVLAHELAHWKKGHVWKGILRGAVKTGVLFAGLYYLVNSAWLHGMFGLPPDVPAAGLLLAGLWLSPLNRWLAPLENGFSLRDEREADRFARRVMGSPEPLVEALYRLVGENLSNPYPHPLYAAFHYTHPTIPERVRDLRASSE